MDDPGQHSYSRILLHNSSVDILVPVASTCLSIYQLHNNRAMVCLQTFRGLQSSLPEIPCSSLMQTLVASWLAQYQSRKRRGYLNHMIRLGEGDMSDLLDAVGMPHDETADTTLQPDYDSTSNTKYYQCYHSDKIIYK